MTSDPYPDRNRPDHALTSILNDDGEELFFDAVVFVSPANWARYGPADWYPGATGPGEYWLYWCETDRDTDLVQYVEPTT